MARAQAVAERGLSRPAAAVDLRAPVVAGLAFVLFSGPYLRGLFFRPELYPTLLVLAVVFAVEGWHALLRPVAAFRWRLPDVAAWALPAAYLVALIGAVDRREAADGALKLLAYAMVYWLAARVSVDAGRRLLLARTLVLAGFGVAGVGVAAATGLVYYPGAFTGREILSTLQYSNALAGYLVTCHVLGLGLWSRERGLGWDLLHSAGHATMLLVVLSTASRGGWLVFPLAVGLVFALLPPQVRWRAFYLEAVVLSAALLAGTRFIPLIFGGEGVAARGAYVAGVAAAVVLVGLYRVASGLVARLDRRSPALVWLRVGALVYVGLMVVAYFGYASSALPVPLAAVMPPEVIRTLQAVGPDENSVLTRLHANADAMKIVRDYPVFGAGAGGWNALYHRYQSVLYWTTEVHNHFMQVWVEAGTVGFLLFAALWGGALYLGWRRWQALRARAEGSALEPPDQEAALDCALLGGLLAAGLALAVHSAMDFDLSLPAVAMTGWAVLGLVRGLVSRVEGRSRQVRHRLLGSPLVATLLALALFVPTWRFHAAGATGGRAAEAMAAGRLDEAESLYRRAWALDGRTATFPADLAQIATIRGLQAGDQAVLAEARELLRTAIGLQPYNLAVRARAVDLLLLHGDPEAALEQAAAVAELLPLDVRAREAWARVAVGTALARLEAGRGAEAAELLRSVVALRDELAARAEARRQPLPGQRSRRIAEVPHALRATPSIELAAVQATALLEGPAAAREPLDRLLATALRGKGEARGEGLAWLAAVRAAVEPGGDVSWLLAEAAEMFPPAPAVYHRVLRALTGFR